MATILQSLRSQHFFMEKQTFRIYRFDEFQLDLKGRRLLDGRLAVRELKPTAFEVLKYLCESKGRLITKKELIENVWHGLTVTEDSPKESIVEIRKALGDKGKEIIKTRHSFGGWSFECRVEEREDVFDDKERTVSADIPGKSISIQEPDEEPARSSDLIDEPRPDPFNVSVETPAEKETEKGTAFGEYLIGETQTVSEDDPGKQGPQEGDGKPTPALDDSDDTLSDRNITFERWLSGPGLWIFLTLLTCVVTTVVLSIVVASKGGEPGNKDAMRAASWAQCLVILLMFLHSRFWAKANGLRTTKECSKTAIVKAGFKNETEFETNRARIEGSLNDYTWYWHGLLLSWVPLYVVYALEAVNYEKILTVVFNLGNTFMVVACFNSLNKEVDEQDREHLAGSVLNIILLMILVGVLIALLLTNHPEGATLLAGIIAGITMALYIGRLQNRFLGPRFWILYLLYSYTAIQPLALYIQGNPGWGWKILDFALLLKCLLYIYMMWLFQSGLLLFYFASVKRTGDDVRQQWKAFKELLRS